MAEDLEEDFEEDGAEPSSGKGGKGKKKLLLMVVLPLLLLVGGAAGAYFAGLADPLLKMVAGGGEEHAAPEAEAAHGREGQPGMPVTAAVFYDLPEMLVDINSADSRRRTFLKLRVALELSGAADTAQVEAMLPRVVDNFQVYLRELRIEDLQGAEGMYRLREELLVRVNAAVRPARVNDVLFKEMLIQ